MGGSAGGTAAPPLWLNYIYTRLPRQVQAVRAWNTREQLQDPACSHPCRVVQSGTCPTMVTAALTTNTLSLLLPRSAGTARIRNQW